MRISRVAIFATISSILMLSSWTSCSGRSTVTSHVSPHAVDVKSDLARAVDAFADTSSVDIKLSVELSPPDGDKIAFDSDVSFTAPSTVFGTVAFPDGGSLNMISKEERVFVSNGNDSVQLVQFLPLRDYREYGGGLVNLKELSDSLTNVDVDTRTTNVEKIHGALSSLGFNSYVERVVEASAIRGLPAYFAKTADIWLSEDTGLPERIDVTRNNEPTGDDHPFRIRIDFSNYGREINVPPVPTNATPYLPPALAALRTPTPGIPTGCAAGTSASPQGDEIGRIYHQGESLSIAVDFSAPGCKSVSADFLGEFLAGSPRYDQICHKQCGDSIFAIFQSGQITLPVTSGTVAIPAKAGPFPPGGSTSDVSAALEGFRLCEVTVTFNDGPIGGTFYETKLGNPQFEFGLSPTC